MERRVAHTVDLVDVPLLGRLVARCHERGIVVRGHDTSSEASADDFGGALRAVALPDQMREADAIELWRVTPQVGVQFLWVRAARRQRPAETTNPADAALVLTMWPYRVAQAVRQRRDALVAAKGGGQHLPSPSPDTTPEQRWGTGQTCS